MALKNWRSRNPEKARNATKRHHDKHREEINEYARAYYASNSDIIKEKHKNDYQENPEKYIASVQKYQKKTQRKYWQYVEQGEQGKRRQFAR